jgi:hypothetical protein
MQNFDHNIGFWEKCQFICQKIAENCDHNIDPRYLLLNEIICVSMLLIFFTNKNFFGAKLVLFNHTYVWFDPLKPFASAPRWTLVRLEPVVEVQRYLRQRNQDQESIWPNSFSAEKFSDMFLSYYIKPFSKFHPKVTRINLLNSRQSTLTVRNIFC